MDNEFKWTDDLVAEYSLSSQRMTLSEFKKFAQERKRAKQPETGYGTGYTRNYCWVIDGKRIPEQQPKEPLFTTEDGKPIYEGDEYWLVDKDKAHWLKAGSNAGTDKRNDGKRFSTKETAEKYIQENKPCLSYSDLKKIAFKYEDTEGLIHLNVSDLKNFIKKQL